MTVAVMNQRRSTGRTAVPPQDPLRYASPYHTPVLWQPLIRQVVTDASGTYIDATLGGGGHAAALLQALDPSGRVVGVDRDPDAIRAVRARLQGSSGKRLTLIQGDFRDLPALLKDAGIGPVHGLILDLGLSSHQIDERTRGFSFDQDGPLDMRMDRTGPVNAAEVVNTWSEKDLTRLFREFGEEPHAHRIARAVVQARPLETTGALAHVVRSVVAYRDAAKTLSRIFQAVRIQVNGELDALTAVLRAAPEVLRSGGRIGVLAYHSLEDRLTKRFFRHGNAEGRVVRDLYGAVQSPWLEITRKPLTASEEECRLNPRARSAKLRIAERR